MSDLFRRTGTGVSYAEVEAWEVSLGTGNAKNGNWPM